jgi:hypothetical protein
MNLHPRTVPPARAALLALLALTATAPRAGDADDIKRKGEKIERFRFKDKDIDFTEKYPGDGTLTPNVQVNTMPTLKGGVTEIRIILSLPGGEFEPRAHLIPIDMPDFDDQNFSNETKERKDKITTPDFKGIALAGNYYQEARRSVLPGRYKLIVLAVRGAEFGRETQAEINIPAFTEGKLSLTSVIFTDKPEKAKPDEPLTIGDYRLIPHAGKYKSGDNVAVFFVVYGASKAGGGYKLKTQLTYQLTAGAAHKDEKSAKLSFKKGENVLETAGPAFSSNGPMMGTGITIPGAPKPAVVTQGGKSFEVPLRWTDFRIKAKITDENSGASIDTEWYDLPLEK